jgi:hypothetical protein
MEGDQEIFKGILEPFIVDPITKVLKKQHLHVDYTSQFFEDEELLDTAIVPNNRYCN